MGIPFLCVPFQNFNKGIGFFCVTYSAELPLGPVPVQLGKDHAAFVGIRRFGRKVKPRHFLSLCINCADMRLLNIPKALAFGFSFIDRYDEQYLGILSGDLIQQANDLFVVCFARPSHEVVARRPDCSARMLFVVIKISVMILLIMLKQNMCRISSIIFLKLKCTFKVR